MPIETLASGEEPPEFLVEGQFYSGQTLIATPVQIEDKENLICAVSLYVEGYEQPLIVRMLTSVSGDLFIMRPDGSLEALDYRRDGRYIVFKIQNGDSIAYFQAEKPSVNPRGIALAALSGLGVLLIALFLLRRRKGRNKQKNKKTKKESVGQNNP